MYAILTHRVAAGDTVDGQDFEHQRWTLLDTLTPALEAARTPEPGSTQPRLRIIEVEDQDDPLLGGLPVVGQETDLTEASEEGDEIDIEHLPVTALKKLAKLLDIPRSQGRAELIASIQAKQAQLAAEDAPALTAEGAAALTAEPAKIAEQQA